MSDPGSPVIDDPTAAALAAVLEALDWAADAAPAPAAPAVGHGKIRLHGRDG